MRRLKKVYGKTKLSDGKPIGGLGRLTDKDINRLQNYFDIAIRSKMKKAIGEVFYHCCEADDIETRHQFCSRKPDAWCHYWKSVNNGSVAKYQPKPAKTYKK